MMSMLFDVTRVYFLVSSCMLCQCLLPTHATMNFIWTILQFMQYRLRTSHQWNQCIKHYAKSIHFKILKWATTKNIKWKQLYRMSPLLLFSSLDKVFPHGLQCYPMIILQLALQLLQLCPLSWHWCCHPILLFLNFLVQPPPLLLVGFFFLLKLLFISCFVWQKEKQYADYSSLLS